MLQIVTDFESSVILCRTIIKD